MDKEKLKASGGGSYSKIFCGNDPLVLDSTTGEIVER
jgi:hypothetical protein